MKNETRTMQRQVRSVASNFKTREDGEEKRIEGYFAVFNSVYEIFPGMTESVAPGAFSETLDGDIRALIDHETMYVLGRNQAGTLELREDDKGLWGSILINPNDQDAMNLYSRVERGDVNQCSFGFDILSEETDFRENGDVHWTISKVRLYEVSVCTFPAYSETQVDARRKDKEIIMKRETEKWRAEMKARLKGESK
ncbi:MAG: HK97 family phage prohead protease [Mogibacterium sp.]|nr:HK97 family phage prohead protease [Mogibacterium sp.]